MAAHRHVGGLALDSARQVHRAFAVALARHGRPVALRRAGSAAAGQPTADSPLHVNATGWPYPVSLYLRVYFDK